MQQKQSQQQIMKKQLSFTSMKPPFGRGGDCDYHHFSSSAAADHGLPLAGQEPDETIVVMTPPPLKRKNGMGDCEVGQTEQNLAPGCVGVIEAALQTPSSGKTGKAQKVPRTTKANKARSQTPVANIGLVVLLLTFFWALS